MSAEYPKVMRIFSFLAARPGVSLGALAAGLRELRPALQQRFGDEARIDMGVRRKDDPFGAIAGDRKADTADALLQVSYHDRYLLSDMLKHLHGLGQELGGLIEPSRSSLSVGISIQVVDCPGDIFFGFVGRRRPDLIPAQMSLWWLEKHAPLSLRLTGKRVRHGYAQVHIDREASSQAAAAAGFPHVPYDMGDSIDIPDLELFIKVLTDPTIQAALYEDEQHFLDHTSWKVAVTDRI